MSIDDHRMRERIGRDASARAERAHRDASVAADRRECRTSSRARSARRHRRRSALRSTAAARSTRPTPRTTARCRSASSFRAVVDDVVDDGARSAASTTRRIVAARRRHEPCRPGLQRRRAHRLLEIPAPRAVARCRSGGSPTVEPGCMLDDLREAAEKHDLTFGPDPATHDHNTLGGMIGNNSCGVHSVMAGPHLRQCRSARHPHL